MKTARTLADRIVDADVRASTWLADGNAFDEAGDKARAQACYDKSQFWHDRWVHLTGNGDRKPPSK